jgi:hypothetical protein
VLVKGDCKDVLMATRQTKYHSGVGKLRYFATWSRLDILNAVREISHHMKEPNQIHFDAMTHLMKYCVSTPDRGRKIEPKELWNGDREFEFVVSRKSDSNFNQCWRLVKVFQVT